MHPPRTNSAAHSFSTKRGKAFEKHLEDNIFKAALLNGLFVRIDRQHPMMVPAKGPPREGPALFMMGKRSGVDYIALLPKGSPFAYLALEAKAVEGETMALSALAEHQITHLNQAVEQGQGALLLAQFFTPLPEVYAVPWHIAPWKRSGNGASMRREELVDAWRLRNWLCLKRVIEWKP